MRLQIRPGGTQEDGSSFTHPFVRFPATRPPPFVKTCMRRAVRPHYRRILIYPFAPRRCHKDRITLKLRDVSGGHSSGKVLPRPVAGCEHGRLAAAASGITATRRSANRASTVELTRKDTMCGPVRQCSCEVWLKRQWVLRNAGRTMLLTQWRHVQIEIQTYAQNRSTPPRPGTVQVGRPEQPRISAFAELI